MTEPLPDTWHSRELPVLRTVVRMYDETLSPVAIGPLEAALPDLSHDDIQRAAHALATAGYWDTMGAYGLQVLRIGSITERARRESGQWPSPQTMADRLLETLAELAEHGSDPVEKAKAKRALEAMGSLGRDLLVSVAGAAAGVAMQ